MQDPRRQIRQDTFDLRDQIHSDDHSQIQAHAEAASATFDDEEHSVLEDDSEEEIHDGEEYDDDDASSLSVPNESIDFDLVYSLSSFAATVEGQANVVKGDSLFLMDDSNSYWWLVRVLKTQEVGYIPAENIETPFERLARLNKHRNVDLASATEAELAAGLSASQDRLQGSRAGSHHTPSPIPGQPGRGRRGKGVTFTPALFVHRYPPAVWNEEEEEEEEDDTVWDTEGYEDEDQGLADEQMMRRREEELHISAMEPDDGMHWDDSVAAEMQRQALPTGAGIPDPRLLHEQQQQQTLYVQQQQAEDKQRELMTQEQRQQNILQQQQQQQQQVEQETGRAVQQQQQQRTLRTSNSRERIDPAEVTETLKLTVTPSIARGAEDKPYLPSAIIEQQQDELKMKRIRDEEEAEEARKRAKGKEKMAPPVSSVTVAKAPAPGKLRKEQSRESDDEGKKKKKGSIFGSFFDRKKEKGKDKNMSVGSVESGEYLGRGSEESSRSANRSTSSMGEGVLPPTTTTAMQQQQQQQQLQPQTFSLRSSSESKVTSLDQQPPPSTPDRPISAVSQHASQLRQRDQQQQALYQKYLNSSPSSPPESSYGLQSESAFMTGSNAYHTASGSRSGTGLGPPGSRPRPGSLILTGGAMDGQGPGVPDLSVIRVFADINLQTDATFKTVLLNSSTTSADLVRQAMQRFRLPAGESQDDYYLTIKQVEGGASAVLLPNEKPLVVFEALVVEAMELPKVKRSSVGSISSVASNLSMHPAIKKLPMNDFTDDSALKFYLNRRTGNNANDELTDLDEETLIADTSHGDSDIHIPRSQYLTVSTTGSNVTPERFTSPVYRFALQLIIYPEDLPDDMVFHPLTEAIVFKDSLRDSSLSATPTVSPHLRRKVFMFPKNITVAEVIELGLERFGITEGVVDGGDEVEDKTTKRRSSSRVRYGLFIEAGSQERELGPSSRVIDAFSRPPTYRAPDRNSLTTKRRSADSAQLLGSIDDVNPDDPVFILRRAVSYRNSSSRHRMSAPLDEIALQKLHRDSASSSYSTDRNSSGDDGKLKQPSRQEIIAAQRAVTRANQRAILSAQTNSVRGMDVLLPGNAMLRSSRFDSNDKMRYSYVEPDGETYDISDIVEEEWQDNNGASKHDLLEGVLVRNKDGIGEKLDRVLNKIKSGKTKERDVSSLSGAESRISMGSISPSEYSGDDGDGRSRSVTPGSAGFSSKMPGAASSEERHSRPGTTTPTGKPSGGSRRHPSIASVMSDLSGYATPPSHAATSQESPRSLSTPKPQNRIPAIPNDDFGVSHMMAIIEYKAHQPKTPSPPLHPVDELLFGRPLDLDSLHPNIRDIYTVGFKQLEDFDKILDTFLHESSGDVF